MIVAINTYELETENIVKFYPCDILGNYQEQSKYTYIKSKDGFEGIYLFNATELLEKIEKGGRSMSKWIKRTTVSCGTILRWRANVVECQCPKCKRWCVNWADRTDYEKCPHCGEDMRKPNCVTCDHFGKCEGCEKREEE